MSTGLQFDYEWRTTAFVVVMVPVLIALGFWQLERAQEKRQIAGAFAQMQQLPAVELSELRGVTAENQLAYRQVALTGEFLPGRYFLLDNRMSKGRYGNEVLALFALQDTNDLVVVNRGWVAADPARLSLPAVTEVEGPVTITGRIYVQLGTPYLLGDEPATAGWPKRLQALDIDKIRRALGADGDRVFPYSVRIAQNQPGAFDAHWPVVNQSPEKHTGYAVQWFAMSFVLALLYLLRNTNLMELMRGSRQRSE